MKKKVFWIETDASGYSRRRRWFLKRKMDENETQYDLVFKITREGKRAKFEENDTITPHFGRQDIPYTFFEDDPREEEKEWELNFTRADI